MANCLRTFKLTTPNYSSRKLTRQLSHFNRDLSSIQKTRCLSQSAPASPHNRRNSFPNYSTALDCSESLYFPNNNDVQFGDNDIQILSKNYIEDFSKNNHKQDFMLYESSAIKDPPSKIEDDNLSEVRVFKLPSNALWYPPGIQRVGSDVFYSVSYCPLEQQVLDDVFNKLPPELSIQGSKYPRPSPLDEGNLPVAFNETKIYDVSAILRDKNLMKNALDLCSVPSNNKESGKNNEDELGLPSSSQLENIKNVLSTSLPKLFTRSMNYTIYEQDLVFDNRIRGKVSHGLSTYIKQVLLFRTFGHFKFATVRFEVLSMSIQPEEGTVAVRWRIVGISGLRLIAKFWKKNIGSWVKRDEINDSWYDGISTYYVNGRGKVYRHVADNVTPDREPEINKNKSLPATIAVLLGLKPSLDENAAANLGASWLGFEELESNECYSQLMLPLEKIY